MNTHTQTNRTNQSQLPDSGNNSIVWTIVAFAVVAILAYAAYNYYSNDYVSNSGSGTVATQSETPAAGENTLGD